MGRNKMKNKKNKKELLIQVNARRQNWWNNELEEIEENKA